MQEPPTRNGKSANVVSGSNESQIGSLDGIAFPFASRFVEIERLTKCGDLEGARKVAGDLKEAIAPYLEPWTSEEKTEKPGIANF
jgi:hypothetical protein